jgi:serine phosphatase RsbU (regulator of sigma subunit)
MRLSPDGASAEIVDAGHAFVAVAGAGQPGRLLALEGGMPIGIEDGAFAHSIVPLAPGQRLVLFSDGVHEQRSPAGDELGLERAIAALPADGDQELDVESMIGLLRAHAAGLPFKDDVSVVSVMRADPSDTTRC